MELVPLEMFVRWSEVFSLTLIVAVMLFCSVGFVRWQQHLSGKQAAR